MIVRFRCSPATIYTGRLAVFCEVPQLLAEEDFVVTPANPQDLATTAGQSWIIRKDTQASGEWMSYCQELAKITQEHARDPRGMRNED